MKEVLSKLSLAALALTGSALTSCIVPGGYYGGPGGPGPGYTGGYRQPGPSYVQDAQYGGQPDDGGSYFEDEGGEVAMLPVGAVYVFEGGERHWYYQGQCYRHGSHGYVKIHRRTVVHHDEHRDVHHDDQHRIAQPPHHEEHHVEEHKNVQPAHHDEHHEDHHEGLIQKNGHTYRKGPDGKLILVK